MSRTRPRFLPSSFRHKAASYRDAPARLRRLRVSLAALLARLLSRLVRRLLHTGLPAPERRRLYRALARLQSDLILAHKILAPRAAGDRVGKDQAAEILPTASIPAPDTTKAASVAE